MLFPFLLSFVIHGDSGTVIYDLFFFGCKLGVFQISTIIEKQIKEVVISTY